MEMRMDVTNPEESFARREAGSRTDTLALAGIALVVAAIHMLTNSRYGFHRDELQFLSDARHMDWGFMAYPPFTPFVERVGLEIFGVSMVGLRLFSVIVQALAIVVTGLMARELGGGRMAQVTAALAVATSGLPVFEGTEFQYSSFDYLWWVLIAYSVIRLLKSENPRWWIAIGAAIGAGLMTKYTICFFIAGILGGMLLSGARRYFLSGWFWAGVGVALLIFLPNFLWQVRHGFISVHFLQHIHVRDVGEGRADGFVKDQFIICANLFAAPLWIAGLVSFLRDRRYRMLGWMYVIPLALFFFGKGRGYYLAAAYPMLMAMGAVAGERWVASLKRGWRIAVEGVFFAGLAAWGLLVWAILVPLASSGPLREFALKNNGDLREEIGWEELVKTVAGIRDSLPPEQRESVGVLVGNYGEQGAVEILGSAYHLPMPISMTNSAWLRGYPTPQPTTLIVLGFSKKGADKAFTDCRLAGHNGNSEGVKNEESQGHPDIFVCGGPRLSWPEFWMEYQSFG
jgi:Dolichyl-phosphate-mannose-protein mannosyltransferase